MALSQIAQSIFLGNGQIWNFLDYAVNRSVSNLLSYTQRNNYIGSNLLNNFSGGETRRYYDHDIPRDEKFAMPTEGDFINHPMTAPVGRGVNIGETYTVPEGDRTKNSNIGFLTADGFNILQRYIRGKNVNRNKELPKIISKKITLKEGTSTAMTNSDGSAIMAQIRYPSDGSQSAISSGSTRLSLRDFDEGLYDLSEKYRDSLIAAQYIDVQYPKDPITQMSVFRNQSDPYGLEKNTSEVIERYSNGEKKTIPDKQSLSSEFTGSDTFIENNVTGNSRTYSYYEEREDSGTTVSIEKVQSMFDTTVRTGSFTNASKLMQRTNDLFKKMKTDTLINRFHTKVPKDAKIDQLLSAYHPVFGLSRGRNLIREECENGQNSDTTSGYDNPYCRVWTAHHQYSKLKDRIRPFMDGKEFLDLKTTQSNYGEMRTPAGLEQLNGRSVLQKNGFVKISPTYDGKPYDDEIKNYMFSIENLAWRDIADDLTNTSLSKEQRGPNGGRIMWFPPYNISFSENINVQWSENNFIGRGESVYTYTNTVRSGTLNFTILIDHPSVVNIWRGTNKSVDDKEKQERDLLRFFAGCGNLNDAIAAAPEDTQTKEEEDQPSIDPKPVSYSKDIAYVIFFPNDFTGNDADMDNIIDVLTQYNSGTDYKTDIRDDAYADEILQDYNLESYGFNPSDYEDRIKETLFGEVNNENLEVHFMDDLAKLKENFTGGNIFGMSSESCEINSIETQGFASSHGYDDNNKTISERRRKTIEKILSYESVEMSESNVDYVKNNRRTITVNDVDGREDVNSVEAKIARAAYAIIRITWKEDNIANSDFSLDESGVTGTLANVQMDNAQVENETTETKIASSSKLEETTGYTYDNEYLYFATLSEDNNLVYKNIVDKVRYFSPSFHSITPEGFNARLTFLQQCTRQGPTYSVSGGRVNSESNKYLKYAGNLAFGRPPYCILRIGDFFNTKIVITSLSIQYDNGGVQWDLNPEGIGVQPMYANVAITFNFIGGQDLSGPVERLQNAVTANYYANASVYSRQADNGISYFDALQAKMQNKGDVLNNAAN